MRAASSGLLRLTSVLHGASRQYSGAAWSKNLLESDRAPCSHACGGSVIWEDCAHPIRDAHITVNSVWDVLARLRGAGFETYIVGGAVRDVLLGQTPKDFDLLTTAQLQQVARLFPGQARKVGKHPIVLLKTEDAQLEIASLHTTAAAGSLPVAGAALAQAQTRSGAYQPTRRAGSGAGSSARPTSSMTWGAARRANALGRDFTVNSLLYEPFSRLIYDYTGGMRDAARRTLRTIGDAEASLVADPVRMLRAVRCAARAGLAMDPSLESALTKLAPRITSLSRQRLRLELASLLSYGAAAPSLRLLWRHGMLAWLLPWHDRWLRQQGAAAGGPAGTSAAASSASGGGGAITSSGGGGGGLLWVLMEQQDRLTSISKPAPGEVWLALLAVPHLVQQLELVARKVSLALAASPEQGGSAAAAAAAAGSPELAGDAGGEEACSTAAAGDAAQWWAHAAAGTSPDTAQAWGEDDAAASASVAAAARAIVRARQGLEAVMQQLVLESVKQVAGAHVPGAASAAALPENKTTAATLLLMTHWRLCYQRSGAGRQALAIAQHQHQHQHQHPAGMHADDLHLAAAAQLPHRAPAGPGLDASVAMRPGAAAAAAAAPGLSTVKPPPTQHLRPQGRPQLLDSCHLPDQLQASLAPAAGQLLDGCHLTDQLQDELIAAAGTGIVWLRPPTHQAAHPPAGGAQYAQAAVGGRSFHSGGGKQQGRQGGGCRGDLHPPPLACGLSHAESLVHEVLTAAAVSLQDAVGGHAAALALRQQRLQQQQQQ